MRRTIPLLFFIAVVASAAPLTVDDYATMPTVSAPHFSPDGKRIAYVLNVADLTRGVYDSDVWLVDDDGSDNIQLTRSPGSDYYPRWSPDGSRIAFLSDRVERTAIYVIGSSGGEAAKLTSEPTAIRDFEWSPDGKSIAFLRADEAETKQDSRVVGAPRLVHLYTIDVASGAVRRLTKGPFAVTNISWSPDGRTIAFDRGPGSGLDDQFRTDIYLIDSAGGDPRPLVVRPGLDHRPFFSPDGRSIAFTSTGGIHDWLTEHFLHVVTIADRGIRNIGRDYGRIPDEILWSTDSRSIWFDGPLDMTSQIFRVGADGVGFTNVSKVDGAVSDADLDPPRRRAVFVYQTLTAPPELFIADLPGGSSFSPARGGEGAAERRMRGTPSPGASRHPLPQAGEGMKMKRLTNHAAAFREKEIAETRLIRWRNPKDGVEIEGLLTLPIGYEAGKRYPLLTFVHGGPASRFDKQFLGYLAYLYPTHVFAARGFAVLRPNPRGTGGYGETFRAANRGDWGGMDWLDVNAGIDTVISQGIADPKRMGFMGWSYGGFLASWAIGHSDRFKAISVGSPVVDLLSFHGTTDIRDFLPHYFPEESSLDEMRHAPLSFEQLRAHSPIWNLKKTSAKVLIQHVEGDLRVPFSQGLMLYRVLDEMGVDVTMIAYPGSGHTPQEPRKRIDAGRRNVEFFEKNVR